MKATRVIQIDRMRPDPSALREAASIVRAGGLVAFPTETVYGLGALALDPDAVSRIFAAKGRPACNPLIVHAADIDQAKTLVTTWSPLAQRLADSFWPGPLTLVLPRSPRVPDVVTGGGPTVAVRIPDHPVALGLLRDLGEPIAAPSANRSEHVSPTRAEHVLDDLEGRVDLILDGGPTAGGIESTVLDIHSRPRILRPGLLSAAEIRAVLGDLQPLIHAFDESKEQVPRSPGRFRRHYSPRTPCECSARAPERVRQLLTEGWRIGWLCLPGEAFNDSLLTCTEMAAAADEYARRLYHELRRLDAEPIDRIVISLPPDHESWFAVRDRLFRACACP